MDRLREAESSSRRCSYGSWRRVLASATATATASSCSLRARGKHFRRKEPPAAVAAGSPPASAAAARAEGEGAKTVPRWTGAGKLLPLTWRASNARRNSLGHPWAKSAAQKRSERLFQRRCQNDEGRRRKPVLRLAIKEGCGEGFARVPHSSIDV